LLQMAHDPTQLGSLPAQSVNNVGLGHRNSPSWIKVQDGNRTTLPLGTRPWWRLLHDTGYMPAFICSTCGTQYPPSDAPPAQCPVCEDERQYIPPEGQSWTTLERLKISHLNGFRQYEPGLIGIGTQPKFAIGQRALLLCTPEGNILWDCISLIDDATVTAWFKSG